MIWVDKAKRFLSAICAKDLDIMSDLFAEEIEFRAWHIDAKTLLTCDVKEAKNRYTGSRGEKIFHIPVQEASLVEMV